MTIERMDHVGVVVDDLAAATEFFVELGLELQGKAAVEGRWVDRVVGLDGVRAEIAMLQTPDGHGGANVVNRVADDEVLLVAEDWELRAPRTGGWSASSSWTPSTRSVRPAPSGI